VRRLALAFIVGMLTLSASGVSSLVMAEPCTGNEPPGQSDSACPPTCVTCGCCAQAAVTVAVAIAASPNVLVTSIDAVLPGLPDTDPRPILHVPKFRFA
jgi:hypothetical protein